jgi:hypothetical protein
VFFSVDGNADHDGLSLDLSGGLSVPVESRLRAPSEAVSLKFKPSRLCRFQDELMPAFDRVNSNSGGEGSAGFPGRCEAAADRFPVRAVKISFFALCERRPTGPRRRSESQNDETNEQSIKQQDEQAQSVNMQSET